MHEHRERKRKKQRIEGRQGAIGEVTAGKQPHLEMQSERKQMSTRDRSHLQKKMMHQQRQSIIGQRWGKSQRTEEGRGCRHIGW